MKCFHQIIILLATACVSVLVLAFFIGKSYTLPVKPTVPFTNHSHLLPKSSAGKKLAARSSGLEKYCKENGFNSSYCFMVDMSVPCGKERFFIYDLISNAVKSAGLVTHGSGSAGRAGQMIFSNKPGSNCTSLGKYKIGKDYHGRFGLAYKLHGLDKSNNNAFTRFVVLHAHSCVPDVEVYPSTICPSLGCPTVSPAFLQKVKSYVDQSDSPVLLYIYN